MDRLRRKMDGSDEGVATTVGTIMALLIFLSILSLITQQYVPIWMEDNEAYHMEEVKGQFAKLKGNIDTLVIYKPDNPLYSSVNLGTSGVPLFAGSSPGRLTFSPRWGEDDNGGVSLSFSDGDEWVSFDESTGNISYHAINREFEDQSLIYEQGAIILEQSDGKIMRAEPHFSIEESDDGEYEISMSMIHLTGSYTDEGGTSRVGITTELAGEPSSYTYSNVGHLFSLDEGEYTLDNGTLGGSDLQEAFNETGYNIDDNANLTGGGNRWTIYEDGDTKYVIQVDGDDLNVYVPERFDWSLTTAYPEVWRRYFENETAAAATRIGNTVHITMPRDEDGNYNINELKVTRVRVNVEIVR